MHPEIKRLTDDQLGLVAVWQLVELGWTRKQIRCRIAGLTRVHDGVLRAGPRQAGRTQRWKAATLTAPDTVLSFASAGDHLKLRTWPRDGGLHATVTRPGSGGRRRSDGVLVHRSSLLGADEIAVVRGVACTTVERTLIDLVGVITWSELGKALREALRQGLTTHDRLRAALDRHARRRKVPALRGLIDRYARLQLHRCRSDAEALALVQLDTAGLPLPRVSVEVAGYEADLYFPDLRLILEIDGPSFHVLKDADARRTLAWTAAGNTVRRIPSDDVFKVPGAVVGIVRAHRDDVHEEPP